MEGKYYGIYRGICVDNEDPENTKRIRLKVPQVLHTNVTNWAYPCLPVVVNGEHGVEEGTTVTSGSSSAGSTGSASAGTSHTHTMSHTHTITLSSHHMLPNINQGVWVMFEGGDVNFPVWIGVY